MWKSYPVLLLFICCWGMLQGQVVTLDSLSYLEGRIGMVYTLTDSLEGHQYEVRIFGVFRGDTVELSKAQGYPRGWQDPGTYRLSWDPIAELGRFRGNARFFIEATPDFRLRQGPEPAYKIGQSCQLAWYGGDSRWTSFEVVLYQQEEPLDTLVVNPGINTISFPLSSSYSPGEGYRFRLINPERDIDLYTDPFVLNRPKDHRWLVWAAPAAAVLGTVAWLIFRKGPLDPPEPLDGE